MDNDDMNRTLAEVEGISTCEHFFDPKNPISTNKIYVDCNKCGVPFNEITTIPDYSTNLEACMRVARKMKVSVGLEVWADGGYTVSVTQGYGYNVSTKRFRVVDPDNPAATLCPMLVEIAKERKG